MNIIYKVLIDRLSHLVYYHKKDGKPIEENIRIAEEAICQRIEELDRKKQQQKDEEI